MGKLAGLRQVVKRSSLITVAFSMFVAWVLADAALFTQKASAAQITNRKVTISSSANGNINVGSPGTGGNGARARYTFSFVLPTTGDVQSILFQICTTPLPGTTCTSPTGFTAANATSVATTGTNFSGFSVDSSTALTGAPWNCTGASPGRTNCIAITRSNTNDPSGTLTAQFGGGASDYITNPTGDNEDFFVRITTYSDTAFTTSVDQGTVAASTAQQIDITAKVQEVLNFSVGAPDSGSLPAPGTTCAPFTDDGGLTLGDATDGALSFNTAYDAHSYFRVSTNANNGTVIYYSGDTLKYGSNDIDSIGTTAAASVPGTEQFGLAIDDSDTQSGNGHSFTSLAPQGQYTNGDGTITSGGTATFAFDTASVTTPVEIANSGTSTIVCDTGSVRYLGNISTTTPPGLYTAAITYIATPTY